MLINIRTDGSRLFADQPVIASGSVGTAAVQFTFDPLWAGYEKSALFRIGAKKYTVLLDKDGACIVPQEALQRSGDVYLGRRRACGAGQNADQHDVPACRFARHAERRGRE